METVLTNVNVDTGKTIEGYEGIFVGVNFPTITVSGASLDTLTQGTPLNGWFKTQSTSSTTSTSTNKEEVSASTWWIWLIVALVVIIGLSVAATFFKKNRSNST